MILPSAMRYALAYLFAAVSSVATNCVVFATDWSQFRGPSGTGVSEKLNLADDFSLEQVSWKSAIGAGTSSIILSQGKLFATSFTDQKRTLHCLDAATGGELWTQSVDSLRKETATPPNGAATCSPVCNGKYVCVLFPDAGLFVYTLDGKLEWKKDLGPFYSMHGISASPILVDDRLIVTVDQLQDPYIVALDVTSGNQLWKVERLQGITGGYSTPALVEIGDQKLIVSAAPGEMVAYDLMSGEKRLSLIGLTNAPVAVPVVDKDCIYYTEPPGERIPMEALGDADKNKDEVIELEEVKNSVGTYRLIERLDKGFGNGDGKVDKAEWDKGFGSFLNKGGLSCLHLEQKDGVIEGSVKWKYAKSTPYIPSALVMDGLVYVINDGGIMICFDGQTGDIVKRERLSGATGQYYASPVGAGNRMILANLQGKVSLLRTGKDFELLKTIDLEEPIVATPSIYQGRLYIRTNSQVYCFDRKV
jgi:outer membrane protein assembly factor BamB